MTVEMITNVWSMDLTPSHKLVMLHLADAYGNMPFDPIDAIPKAARQTGYTVEEIKAIFEELKTLELIKAKVNSQLQLTLPNTAPNLISPLTERDTSGYVYLLSGDNGFFKIGRSKRPAIRVSALQTQMPFEIKIVRVISSANMYELERSLHSRFASRRAGGEWFKLSDADVADIVSIEDDDFDRSI